MFEIQTTQQRKNVTLKYNGSFPPTVSFYTNFFWTSGWKYFEVAAIATLVCYMYLSQPHV